MMLAFITGIPGKLWGLLAAIGAALAVVLGAYKAGGDNAREKARRRAAENTLDDLERGRDAVQDIRGADRTELDQRLRDNDGQW